MRVRAPARTRRTVSCSSSTRAVDVVRHLGVEVVGHARRRTSGCGRRAPCRSSSAARIRSHQVGRDRRAVGVAWRSGRSTSASQAHSSSICEGASTKSHSVATPEKRAHSCRPPSTWWTRWPNSWNSVTTSPCSISPRGKLQTSTPSGSWRPSTPGSQRRTGRRGCTCPRAGAGRGGSARARSPVEVDVVDGDVVVPARGVRDVDVLQAEQPCRSPRAARRGPRRSRSSGAPRWASTSHSSRRTQLAVEGAVDRGDRSRSGWSCLARASSASWSDAGGLGARSVIMSMNSGMAGPVPIILTSAS